MKTKNIIYTAIFVVITAALPLFIKAPYQLHMLILVMMWAVIGTAWNLLGRYAGQVFLRSRGFLRVGGVYCRFHDFSLRISPWGYAPSVPLWLQLYPYPSG